MRLSHLGAAPLALLLCAGGAHAATVSVSGFGTAGYTVTDTDDADFVRGGQAKGADSDGEIGVDSIAGIQATAKLTERFSATAQLLFRRLYDQDMTLDVPLAFVKADVTKGLAVRLGRVPLPLFMVSDFRQVGYANTWIRPPVEVYQFSLDSFDGADVLYTGSAGALSFTSQAFYGRTDVPLSSVDLHVKNFWGVNASATWGPVTFRAGRAESRLTLEGPEAVDQLLAGARAAGFATLADDLTVSDKPSSFTAFGVVLDWNHLIVQAEHTKSVTGGYPADNSSDYALVGYRIQKFTPYAIYAETRVDSARTSNVIPQVGPLIPLALGINAIIAGSEQNTTSAGVRWDVADSVDVKFQYDHVDPEGAGLFANAQPGFKGPVNVFGIAVDVVF